MGMGRWTGQIFLSLSAKIMKVLLLSIALFGAAKAILEDNTVVQNSRIVGGNVAVQGQFPYQVALMLYGSVFCGATWIKSNSVDKITIVTAAHCIEGLRNAQINNLKAVVGLHDRGNLNDIGVVQLTPESITMHRNYDSVTYSNDIAIIIVATPPSTIEATSWARPIGLTQIGYSDGELGTVSGWGTLESEGTSPYVLHYVTKPILSLNNCKSTSYDASWLDNTMMCCGSSGKDACQGDSGGPLVTTRNGETVLVGVVSWGYGCGFDGYPGVYADVNYLRSWIVTNSAN